MNDDDTEKPRAVGAGMKTSGAETKPDEPHTETEEIDPLLLRLLVCPFTKTQLRYDAQTNELISEAARLAFPVRHGVPLMTRESARHLDD